MAKISIGRTGSGAAITIETQVGDGMNIGELFGDFSEGDKYDALMALGYLGISEIRKNSVDKAWLDAIRLAYSYLEISLGKQTIAVLSESLGLTSAFAARDYGKALVHKHFRYL